ncbi:hypothetical protein E2C01_058889 [Portunus trituberculatus]|uniref:Uncharacterized protein n=1 Tax=Portunus trituberculatus TaxID=210409 RepID=A0A5B7H6V6_PORTR|nr:hypothetical protein [Portunus trituberculatus]
MDRFLLERTVILAQEREVRQIKSSLLGEPSGAKADKRLDEIEEQLKQLSMNQRKRRLPLLRHHIARTAMPLPTIHQNV